MKKDYYILGAGNQARETYQIYIDNGLSKQVRGFIVSDGVTQNKLLGKKIFGVELLDKLSKKTRLINAVGNSFKRMEWLNKLRKYDFVYDTLVHKSVLKGRNVEIGEGATVCAGVVLTCDIKIGKHVLINIGSTVSHDVVLGDLVTLSPGVSLGGRVEVGQGTFIGIGATVIQNVKIGKNSFIGGGAAVVDDIPDNTLAYGVPAKQIRKISQKDWLDLI